MAVEPRPKLSYADYVNFPDDGIRRELIDGEVFVTPSPNTRHQDIVLRLARLIADFLDEHGGGRVFVAPYDVLLSEHDVVEPDVVYVDEDRLGVITEAHIRGTPTLLAEVVSDPRTDRVRKRELYAGYGVPEYWVVDPDADRVEVDRLTSGRYDKPDILEPGDTLRTPALPGLEIDLAKLFAR